MATKLTKRNSKPIKPIKTNKPQVTTRKGQYTSAVGRRRSSVARVRLFSGKSEPIINDKVLTLYFRQKKLQDICLKPFIITDTLNKQTASIKVSGGGISGQAEAIAHGLARAFIVLDPEHFKTSLREAGLVTRDPRMKETRKVGRGGKARFKKQSPKR